MRVLLLPKYGRMAASARHRLLQYLPALNAAGIDCDVQPLFSDEYLERKFRTGRTPPLSAAKAFARRIAKMLASRRYDLLVVHCELLPYFPAWFERLLTRVPYVLDFDDAIFLQYGTEAPAAVRRVCGDKMGDVFAHAALVTPGNEYLADYARQTARRVEIVPTVVDTNSYVPRPSRAVNTALTIGWIGSPSTAEYLSDVARPLASLCSTDKCRVTIVGAGQVRLPAAIDIDYREWSEGDEIAQIQSFDVGIMPLPDTPWARGKCGFKLIQYMACGLPVVASPVGVNSQLVEHGINGFLANDAREWSAALETLARNPQLRARMGQSGRSLVDRHYSLATMAPRVVSLIRDTVSAGRTRAGAKPVECA